MLNAPHTVSHTVSVVGTNHPTAEEILQCVEQLDIALVLNNGKFRKHLIFCSHIRMAIDTDEEATFSVRKANDPLCIKFHGQD